MKQKLNLTDNLFLKILSVVLAIILWLVVLDVSDAEITKKFTVGVNLINTEVITNNGKVFRVVEGTDRVTLTVRARTSVFRELKDSDFILTADMQKNLKYDSQVAIIVECKNRNINVDEDVTLSSHNVEVSIEDSATEQFQVNVSKVGQENEGLVVGSMIPEQTIIKITGPVSIVERIKTVQAQVDVTGIPGTTVKTCELKLYDSDGGLIDNTYLNYIGKTNGIDVTVSMLNTKSVPLKFSYMGTPAENYVVKEISFKPEVVDIAGNAGVLSSISKLEIPEEAVNVEGIDDELQLVVDLTQYLPSGVILKNGEDASVLVIVEVEYVEPEEETEKEEEENSNSGTSNSETTGSENSKPSSGSSTKPSEDENSGNGSQADKNETTGGGSSAGGGQSGSGSESDSSQDTTTGTDHKNNQNNEAGSGKNDKTESNS